MFFEEPHTSLPSLTSTYTGRGINIQFIYLSTESHACACTGRRLRENDDIWYSNESGCFDVDLLGPQKKISLALQYVLTTTTPPHTPVDGRREGNSIYSIRAVLKACLSTVLKRFQKGTLAKRFEIPLFFRSVREMGEDMVFVEVRSKSDFFLSATIVRSTLCRLKRQTKKIRFFYTS